MKHKYLAMSSGLVGLLACATVHASCGGAVCSMNTNWDEHSLGHSGWSGDLRYSYTNSDTLRSGSDKISADMDAEEVENIGTTTRIITATADYTYNNHWGTTVILPFINRDHAHNVGPYTGDTPADYESFNTNALGDIKVLGRYRWSLDQASSSGMGVKFGLKLSTGKQDAVFEQTGEKPSEVTLQAGNGSTDMILGLFWYQSVPGSDWNWFTQATLQNSIKKDATFRPGNQVNLDGGTRYAVNHDLSALLQVNVQWNDSDSGESAALTEAGEPSSGARSVSLTPGVNYAVTRNTQLYGLLQLPFYQYVKGEQLTPSDSISVGVNHRF